MAGIQQRKLLSLGPGGPLQVPLGLSVHTVSFKVGQKILSDVQRFRLWSMCVSVCVCTLYFLNYTQVPLSCPVHKGEPQMSAPVQVLLQIRSLWCFEMALVLSPSPHHSAPLFALALAHDRGPS